ncbi:F-box/kelch-repeat protein [Abeliophyllum distichum]|uniref:F-box/kelch-repeat protein n=1 Tax=Abeliophyllum distichum TaxID=126358 RepID=A0ABD1Q029_9LAMI
MDIVPINNHSSDIVRVVRIVGSCNGLICLVLEPRIVVILNPATKKSRKLPVSVKSNRLAMDYGFGYDESNNDYKVVEISWTNFISDKFENQVKVYSSKTESWRIIDGTAGFIVHGCGVFANGAIHWKVQYPDGNPMDWFIIAYNVTTDRYKMVAIPQFEIGLLNSLLVVSAGRLCVSCKYSTHADIWVMKEYEVEESWTKLVRVPNYLDLKSQINTTPFFVLENGGVLLKNGFSIVMYRPLNECIEINTKGFVLYVSTYTESLVFPDFGHDDGT